MLFRFTPWLVYALSALVFILASVSVALSLTLGWMSDSPRQASEKLSEWLGVELSYSRLDFAQKTTRFALEIDNFSLGLGDEADTRLSIRQLAFDLDVWRSVLHLAPKGERMDIRDFVFTQSQLSEKEVDETDFWRTGFPLIKSVGFHAFNAWQSIGLDQAVILWQRGQTSRWQLALKDLSRAEFKTDNNQLLALAYQLRHQIKQPSGEFITQAKGFAGRWLIQPTEEGVKSWLIQQGDQGSLSVQLDWTDLDVLALEVNYQGADFGASAAMTADLSGPDFTVQRLNSWRFNADSKLVFPQQAQQTSPLTIRRLTQGWQLESPSLNLALLNPWIASSKVPLPYLKGVGEFFSLYLDDVDFLRSHGRVSLRQADIGFEGLRKLSELDSLVSFGQGKLVFDLQEGQQTTLDWPVLFDQPVPIENLQGQLTLTLAQDNLPWRLDSQGLMVEAKDLKPIFADLAIYQGHSRDMRMQLSLDFSPISASVLKQGYLPRVLNKALRDWLTKHIQSGQLQSARLDLDGDLNHLGQRRTAADRIVFRGDLVDVSLNPASGWADIEHLSGHLLFENGAFSIQQVAGQTRGIDLNDVRLALDSTSGFTRLKIDGKTDTQAENLMAYLEDSPLSSVVSKENLPLSPRGLVNLKLGLTIPLEARDTAQVGYQVDLALKGKNTLDLLGETFTQLRGQVQISNDGITANALSGLWRGEPVSASIKPMQAGMAQWLLLNAQGRTQVSLGQASGLTNLRAHVEIPWRHFSYLHAQVKIESKPLSLDYPVPFSKEVGEDWLPLTIDLVKGHGQQDWMAAAWLEERAYFFARLGQTQEGLRLKEADLQLGRAYHPRALLEETLQWKAKLGQVDVDEWLAYVAALPSSQSAWNKKVLGELAVDSVRLHGQVLTETRVDFSGNGAYWQGVLKSDWIKGRFRLEKERYVDVRLEKLNWPVNPLTQAMQSFDLSQASVAKVIDKETQACAPVPLAGFQRVALSIDQLRFAQQKDAARVNLAVQRYADRLDLTQLDFVAPGLTIQGSGQWDYLSHSDQTRMTLNAKADSLRDFSRWSALPIKSFKAKDVDLSAQLQWPGSPMCFNLASIKGQGQVSMGKGTIIEAEPGLGRLIGLLNITSLTKRLFSFDLSDFFSQGLVFDKVRTHFELQNQQLNLQAFRLDSSATKVALKGGLNLARRDYDLEAAIEPNVSEAMVTLGFLTSGPVGGFGAWLASKLVSWASKDDPLTYYYAVTGPFTEPNIEAIKRPEK